MTITTTIPSTVMSSLTSYTSITLTDEDVNAFTNTTLGCVTTSATSSTSSETAIIDKPVASLQEWKQAKAYVEALNEEEVKELLAFIDEKEAEAIRLIYDLYLKDYTRQAIINELDRRGLKPRFTKKWTFQAFRKILHNEKYMGAAYLQKTFVK